MIIKWTKRYSGETGHVKHITSKGAYFENTFDINEAKRFNKNMINRALRDLNDFCPDNTYESIEV